MFLPSNITLKFGDTGDFVAELQRRLASVGSHPSDAISGSYDGLTVNSVSTFQGRSGLRADGVAGPETLRKLNGVISGDTSGTSGGNQNEEEAKKAAAENVLRTTMLEEQLAQQAPGFGVRVEEAPAMRTETYAAAEPAYAAAQTAPQPAQAALTEQQMLQQQIQRELLNQQTAQATAVDPLAQMLLQQTAQASREQPSREQQPQQQNPSPPPLQVMQNLQMQQPQQQPLDGVPQQGNPAAVPATQEQPKGIVGRALQKMDGMLQRMSDYFEAKLPPDVMREVKEIGLVMAQSGVKQAAIPTGPEQGQAPVTPARGPDQQQIPTRG